MTDLELKTFFTNLVDDEDFTDASLLVLFNNAKNKLELEAKPQWLITKDTSKTGAPGDTYLTTKALPTGFRSVKKMYYGEQELFPVSFENSIRHKTNPNRYYIDHKNRVFAQTGSINKAETYTLFYLVASTDFTSFAGTTTLTWPDYHALVAFEAAKIYQASMDADDLAFRMSQAQDREYRILRDAFMGYNSELGLDAEDGTMGYADENTSFDLGQL